MKTYTVESLPSGGFVVTGPGTEDDFASTTLDEALRYIREKLLPPLPDPEVEKAQRDYASFMGQQNAHQSPDWYPLINPSPPGLK